MSVILTDDGYRDEGGKLYDRVTEVCRLVYVDDPFQFVTPETLEKASERGSAIHRLTSNEAEPGDEEWRDWAEGWLNFLSDTQYQEIASERTVHHYIYGYAGTLDSFGIMPPTLAHFSVGRNCVVEKKTTRTLPLTIGLQTAAYQAAINSEIDTRALIAQPCRARYVVWLRPEFTRGYKLIGELDKVLINGCQTPLMGQADWQTFIGLLSVKRWRERYLKAPKRKTEDKQVEEITFR